MDVVQWFVSHLTQLIYELNKFSFMNVPLWVWLMSFLIVSMVISVFWRGARG